MVDFPCGSGISGGDQQAFNESKLITLTLTRRIDMGGNPVHWDYLADLNIDLAEQLMRQPFSLLHPVRDAWVGLDRH